MQPGMDGEEGGRRQQREGLRRREHTGAASSSGEGEMEKSSLTSALFSSSCCVQSVPRQTLDREGNERRRDRRGKAKAERGAFLSVPSSVLLLWSVNERKERDRSGEERRASLFLWNYKIKEKTRRTFFLSPFLLFFILFSLKLCLTTKGEKKEEREREDKDRLERPPGQSRPKKCPPLLLSLLRLCSRLVCQD